MAGTRQPVDLILAKGRKHVTQEFVDERRKQEIKPLTENIVTPSYLSKKQKVEFEIIKDQLVRMNVMSETDVDAVARYVIAKELYVSVSKQINKPTVKSDPVKLESYLRNQDKLFKQCRVAAGDLGLTISSRCRLILPPMPEQEKENNKFEKFKKHNEAV